MDVINNKKKIGMDPLLASTIVGGAGSLINGAVNGIFQRSAQNKQYQNDVKLLDKQFELNKSMWDLQNAYNDPSAQRDRMEAAGFNPNLLTGGATTSGNASSAPQYGFTPSPQLASYMDVSSIFDNIAKMMQMKQAEKSIEVSDQQMALYKAQSYKEMSMASKLIAETEGTKMHNDFLPKQLSKGLELLDGQLNNLNADTNKKAKEADYFLARTEGELANRDYLKAKTKWTEADINRVNKSISLMASEIVKNYAQAHNLNVNSAQVQQMTPFLIQKITSEIDLNDATSALRQAEKISQGFKDKLTVVQIDHTKQDMYLKKHQTAQVKLENNNLHSYGNKEAGGKIAGELRGFATPVANIFDIFSNWIDQGIKAIF